MLKQRIVTAAFLIPIVIGLIFYADLFFFALFFGLFFAIGAWEWATICGLDKKATYTYCLFFVLSLIILYWFNDNRFYQILIIAGVLYWLYAIVCVLLYQSDRNILPKSYHLLSIIGFLILLPMWSGLVYLKKLIPNGASLIMFLMLTVWIADTGAYFIGKKWGKNKLAYKVSPGKTWEGTIAGLFFGILFAVLYVYTTKTFSSLEALFIALSIAVVSVSVFGDLMESIIKREAKIKDSGAILPGHGGVMDRIDSLTAATPVFVGGLILLGIIK